MTEQNSAGKSTRKKRSGTPARGPAALEEARSEAARLKAENENLRNELEQVLANASDNEKIWRHFAALERLLFRMRELDHLTDELLREMRVRFQAGLIVLYASHPEIQERLFEGEPRSSSPGERTWVAPMEGEEVRALFGPTLKPVLFSDDDGQKSPFPERSSQMRSGALIPLNIGEFLFGALLLGSPDSERYRPGDGTDLLERLGTNIALSMDNCLTYEKVRDLAVQDHLTGLFNFFQIFSLLEREFRKARRSNSALSVLVVDFNFVQDPDDLDTGKEVLKHAARLLDDILPEERCFIGRYGSDQFLAVLPGVPEEEAREVIPYISTAIRKAPFKFGNTAILITTRIGTATLTDAIACAQDLVDAAYAELCSSRGRPA
ncbi:MAG: sensor domain-containing diguanylate cyclase [Syntrophobacteraceae bacterium]